MIEIKIATECKVSNWNYEDSIEGKIFVSDHFICFHSNENSFVILFLLKIFNL